MTIYTIGYEGADLGKFLQTLTHVGVDVLADVRAVAVSRRRGFSKTALAAAAQEAGLGYVHFRPLGDPKPGREAARAGQFRLFERIYVAHLETEEAKASLNALTELAGKRCVALMCYEADALHCHRTVIARRLAKVLNQRIVNLDANISGLGLGSRTHYYPRQGLAAA